MKALIVPAWILLISFFLQKEEDELPINQIQVIGSHNSFKKAIDPLLFRIFRQTDSVSAGKLDYGHPGFAEQLDMGLRNLELDIYADERGGRYSHPKGLEWAAGQQTYDTLHEMDQPGFKLLHIPDLDFRSNAFTFKAALQQLREWSEKHPGHTPVFITLEAKDDSLKRSGFTQPEPFTEKTFDDVDRAILAQLGKEHLIVPDQVRGKYKTLEEAVLQGNWPKLKSAKGKFAFVLDAQGKKRAAYIKGHPSLKNRMMFANADPGNPEAAMMLRNNAKDPEIPGLVKKGYIIRTRADIDTQQARSNDYSFFEAACASGAQIITTDYYRKSTHFKSGYSVNFSGLSYFRRNPLFN